MGRNVIKSRGVEWHSAQFPHRVCPRRDRIRHADCQRLPALSRLCARTRPRHLGARQSRRHGARAGRARRSVNASGKPHRRAGRQSLFVHGRTDLCRPRRHGEEARSRAVGRYALRDQRAGVAEGLGRGDRRAAPERAVSPNLRRRVRGLFRTSQGSRVQALPGRSGRRRPGRITTLHGIPTQALAVGRRRPT